MFLYLKYKMESILAKAKPDFFIHYLVKWLEPSLKRQNMGKNSNRQLMHNKLINNVQITGFRILLTKEQLVQKKIEDYEYILRNLPVDLFMAGEDPINGIVTISHAQAVSVHQLPPHP